MGHTEGDPKGGKREFNPWGGREEKEREKRGKKKTKPGRGCPLSTQGQGGWGSPAELP